LKIIPFKIYSTIELSLLFIYYSSVTYCSLFSNDIILTEHFIIRDRFPRAFNGAFLFLAPFMRAL